MYNLPRVVKEETHSESVPASVGTVRVNCLCGGKERMRINHRGKVEWSKQTVAACYLTWPCRIPHIPQKSLKETISQFPLHLMFNYQEEIKTLIWIGLLSKTTWKYDAGDGAAAFHCNVHEARDGTHYDLSDWIAKAICSCDFVMTNTLVAFMSRRAAAFLICHHGGKRQQLEHAFERKVILAWRRLAELQVAGPLGSFCMRLFFSMLLRWF